MCEQECGKFVYVFVNICTSCAFSLALFNLVGACFVLFFSGFDDDALLYFIIFHFIVII